MLRIPALFFVSAAATIFLTGCEELTETVLTDKQVIITAPVDNLVTGNTSNSFVWEPVNGAKQYQVQIVSPRFDSVARFVTDSVLTKNSITFTLIPGKYQWRVRALNTSTQTSYFTRNITIQ